MISQALTRKQMAWMTLTLVVATVFCLWSHFIVSSEPTVRGKTIGQWFKEAWSTPNDGEPGWIRRFHPYARVDPALQAISEMGSDAVPFLLRKLNQNDSGGRGNSLLAHTRAKLPISMQRYFPEYRTTAQERFIAIRALAQIGPPAREAVPALTAVLNNEGLNGAAIYALGKIGPDSKSAVPELNRLLQHEMDVHTLIGSTWRHGRAMRPLLLETLAAIGPDAEASVPVLIADIEGYAARMNEISNYMPVSASSRSNRTERLRMFEKIEKNNRFLAASALWRIDPSKKDIVVSALSELLEGEEFWNPSVAIGSFAPPRTSTWLGPKGGRRLVARLLGEIGDPRATPLLAEATKDADGDFGREATAAVEKIRNKHYP